MRTVLVTHHYPPSHIGGVELIVERIAQWLAAHGHRTDVICVESVDLDRPEHLGVSADEQNGVTVHRIVLGVGEDARYLGLLHQHERLGDWFKGLLGRFKPDVVDIHSCYLTSTSVITAAKRLGLPVLLTLHDYWFLCPWMTLLKTDGSRCSGAVEASDCAWCLLTQRRRYRLADQLLRGRMSRVVRREMKRGSVAARMAGWDGVLKAVESRRASLQRALESADLIIAKSPFLKERLVIQSAAGEKVRVLTSGLKLNEWQSSGEIDTGRRGVRIGYIGQISPRKGIHVLIKAFQQLEVSDTKAVLEIHGGLDTSPAYAAELRKLSRGSDNIIFAGRYENVRVAKVLAGIDVLVVPSQWYETGPLVTLEGFASRTPVVATDLPNMNNQVTDGVDGLLFAPGDADDLARQLQRILDEPRLLGRLSANIGPVKSFEEEMREIMQLYHTVGRTREGKTRPLGSPLPSGAAEQR